ncbi:MAG: hypothetical protein ACLPQS_07515 [Acidimicrobiales bacterium]
MRGLGLHVPDENEESALSDVPQGDGWWIASDGKWYPPHLHPDAEVEEAPADPPPGWWQASDGKWYPPEQHPEFASRDSGSRAQPAPAPSASRAREPEVTLFLEPDSEPEEGAGPPVYDDPSDLLPQQADAFHSLVYAPPPGWRPPASTDGKDEDFFAKSSSGRKSGKSSAQDKSAAQGRSGASRSSQAERSSQSVKVPQPARSGEKASGAAKPGLLKRLLGRGSADSDSGSSSSWK